MDGIHLESYISVLVGWNKGISEDLFVHFLWGSKLAFRASNCVCSCSGWIPCISEIVV